jgi:hypothetical protein
VVHEALLRLTKLLLFVVSILWSLWLSWRLLGNQQLPVGRRWLPLIPGLAGSLAVGAAWWPGIFGL